MASFFKAHWLFAGMGTRADADDRWWTADVRFCTALMAQSFDAGMGITTFGWVARLSYCLCAQLWSPKSTRRSSSSGSGIWMGQCTISRLHVVSSFHGWQISRTPSY